MEIPKISDTEQKIIKHWEQNPKMTLLEATIDYAESTVDDYDEFTDFISGVELSIGFKNELASDAKINLYDDIKPMVDLDLM